MSTPQTLDLNNFEIPSYARQAAEKMASAVVLGSSELESLLNPLRHHRRRLGEKRANQIRDEYQNFRNMTVDMIISATGVPAGPDRARIQEDLKQRAETVNRAYREIVNACLDELDDPSPPPDWHVNPPGAGWSLHRFGTVPISTVSRGITDMFLRTEGHFWNSVQKRVECNTWEETNVVDDDDDPPWADYDDDECGDFEPYDDEYYGPQWDRSPRR